MHQLKVKSCLINYWWHDLNLFICEMSNCADNPLSTDLLQQLNETVFYGLTGCLLRVRFVVVLFL